MSADMVYQWDGAAMRPLPRFAKQAGSQFVTGENYCLEAVQQRSSESHRFYFACLNLAYRNLPEIHAGRWPTVDHMRKFALVQCGYRMEMTYASASKAEALRVAALMRGLDEFVVVTVDDTIVHRCIAKSQSMSAMSRKEFEASKTAVLGYVSKLIGVAVDELSANARREAA